MADELVLSSPSQWRAISSSVRLQMVDLLRMLGPCAVPRLAEALDRPADGLYHHVRILERAGIVRRVGMERMGARVQAVYAIVARNVRLPIERSDARNAKQLSRVTASVLRTAERGVSAAIRQGGLRENGPERNLWCRIHTGRVDGKRLARLNALLREIEAEIDAGRDGGEGTTMSLVLAFWPSAGGRRYDGGPSVNPRTNPSTPTRTPTSTPTRTTPNFTPGDSRVGSRERKSIKRSTKKRASGHTRRNSID